MTYFSSIRAFVLTYKWYVAAAVVALAAAGFFVFGNGNGDENEPDSGLRKVELVSVADYGGGGVAVPTAQGNSYIIRAEAGGKITRVVAVGATVAAGTIVAEVENSAQRAAVTQAEGAYEVTLATSDSNETTQQTALQDGARTWVSATVSAAEEVRTSVDDFFGTVRSTQGTSGFQLEAFGAAEEFNTLRSEIEDTFDRWEAESVDTTNATDALTRLAHELATIGNLIDRVAALVPRQAITAIYSESDRAADATTLATARAAITALQEDVDDALAAITNASGSGSASASAGVKQALGALEAARAAYAKTLIRTPLAGTVLSRGVTVGDIITSGADVAIVRAAGDSTGASFALPLAAVKYTPAGAFVFTVEDSVLQAVQVETGLVTANAIQVTGLHGDEKIVRDVRGLKQGQHVSLE